MCVHYEPHPVLFLEGAATVVLLASSIWWRVVAPTPRPGLRAIAAYAAALTVLFIVVPTLARDPARAGNYVLATLSGLLLAGCLIAEVCLHAPPRAAEIVVALPHVRIVSRAAASRGRDRIARAIARGRGETPSPARR